MVKRIAVYPGTFDPLTRGHISIIKRGTLLFDTVLVAVAKDNNKTPLFNLDERVALAREVFAQEPGVVVEPFEGLLVNYALSRGASTIIRGLRAVSDFEYEFQLALMNRKLCSELQTVFLMSDFNWMYVSSTMIKSVASLGGNVNPLVPPAVVNALRQKFGHPETWPELCFDAHPDFQDDSARC